MANEALRHTDESCKMKVVIAVSFDLWRRRLQWQQHEHRISDVFWLPLHRNHGPSYQPLPNQRCHTWRDTVFSVPPPGEGEFVGLPWNT
jgi:hypothetical protein